MCARWYNISCKHFEHAFDWKNDAHSWFECGKLCEVFSDGFSTCLHDYSLMLISRILHAARTHISWFSIKIQIICVRLAFRCVHCTEWFSLSNPGFHCHGFCNINQRSSQKYLILELHICNTLLSCKVNWFTNCAIKGAN